MHGTNDLDHDGIAHLAGCGDELVTVGRNLLGHNGDSGCLQQGAYVIGGDIAVLLDAVDDGAHGFDIHFGAEVVGGGRLGRVAHADERLGQSHLVGKVHMTLVDELLHLAASDVQARQHGEDGLLAGEHLLVQHGIGVIAGHQTRRTKDDHDGIHVVVALLAEVDAYAQVLGSTRGQEVDGVGNR